MYKFIFSNNLSYRLFRHISFWIARVSFLTLSSCVGDYNASNQLFSNVLDNFESRLVSVLRSEVIFCYIVIYLLAPKFLSKKKYLLFTVSVLIITIIMFTVSAIFRYKSEQLTPDMLFNAVWYTAISFTFVGPITICGIFLSIKMLKTWYLKEEEKQVLLAANSNAEIQLLKAQIHPHFLFNTLNNIYAFTLNKSPQAAELVSKLSDTMNYMIKDCEVSLVPLVKEIKMLKDYIELEKVRYGERLDLTVMIEGACEDKLITPLLMIPFVENSFKHGASKLLKSPWIQLYIQADEAILHFTLVNNKPTNGLVNNTKGIGLANVKKRLQLLYPQNHLLLIESTENTFTVNMQIPLYKIGERIVV
jgi:sensor histidine kinase YesM